MARGFGALGTAKQDIDRRKAEGGGEYVKRFYLQDGETAVVRFLEEGDEVACCWVHMIDVPGRKVPLQIPCRDQDAEGRRNLGIECPGCEKDYPLKFRGKINLIWRDAPINEKVGEKWETTGNEDQIAVWDVSFEKLQELGEDDVNYKGLKSRDFKVRRIGSSFDTKYFVSPADVDGGPQPMSKEDQELAESKYDVVELTTAPDLDSWGVRKQEKQEVTPERKSPFARRSE